MSTTTITDPVGTEEIAAMLGVTRQTVHSWRKRARHMTQAQGLPDPDAIVTKTPIWSRATILKWAEETRRIPEGAELARGPGDVDWSEA